MTPAGQVNGRWEKMLVLAAAGVFAALLCFKSPSLLEAADFLTFHWPNLQFLTGAVRHGHLPLWNPYTGLGRPFLAYCEDAVFYPPSYLALLGLKPGIFLLVWLHTVIAIVGMRKLGAALEVGRWQSYFMALCFIASGPMIAKWQTGELFMCCSLSYLPWLFAHAVRARELWNARRVAAHAFLLAMQFLCGHPQAFWISCMGQGLFILCSAFRLPWREGARDLGRAVLQFGCACVCCAGLAAALLLPFAELISQANRVGASPEFVDFLKLEWQQLSSLISPLGIFRTPVGWEANLFVGVLIFMLGILGLTRVRERNVRGLLGVAIGGLLLAVGSNTPCFDVFYDWLPGFADFRIHARTAVLIVLALICAAGIWLSRPHPKLRKLTTRFNVPQQWLIIFLIAFQTLNLALAARIMRHVYAFDFLMGYSAHFPARTTLIEGLRAAKLPKPGQPPPRVCVPEQLVPFNYAMTDHFSTFDAKTALFLRRPWDYLHTVIGVPIPELMNTTLSSKIYMFGPFPYRDVALVAGFTPDSGKLVFATNPSPRAFIVHATEVVNDYDAILKRLANNFDVHQCALLEQPMGNPLPTKKTETTQPPDEAIIRDFEPESLELDVYSQGRGLLVLAEAWYPGWQAEIDGQIYPCIPANIWMRAIPVPTGWHQVRIFFRQNRLVPGVAISLTSAMLLVVVWLKKPKTSA